MLVKECALMLWQLANAVLKKPEPTPLERWFISMSGTNGFLSIIAEISGFLLSFPRLDRMCICASKFQTAHDWK